MVATPIAVLVCATFFFLKKSAKGTAVLSRRCLTTTLATTNFSFRSCSRGPINHSSSHCDDSRDTADTTDAVRRFLRMRCAAAPLHGGALSCHSAGTLKLLPPGLIDNTHITLIHAGPKPDFCSYAHNQLRHLGLQGPKRIFSFAKLFGFFFKIILV